MELNADTKFLAEKVIKDLCNQYAIGSGNNLVNDLVTIPCDNENLNEKYYLVQMSTIFHKCKNDIVSVHFIFYLQSKSICTSGSQIKCWNDSGLYEYYVASDSFCGSEIIKKVEGIEKSKIKDQETIDTLATAFQESLKIASEVAENLVFNKIAGRFDDKRDPDGVSTEEAVLRCFKFKKVVQDKVCCVCYDLTTTLTDCGHRLCMPCWEKIENKKCPCCRKCIDTCQDE